MTLAELFTACNNMNADTKITIYSNDVPVIVCHYKEVPAAYSLRNFWRFSVKENNSVVIYF